MVARLTRPSGQRQSQHERTDAPPVRSWPLAHSAVSVRPNTRVALDEGALSVDADTRELFLKPLIPKEFGTLA